MQVYDIPLTGSGVVCVELGGISTRRRSVRDKKTKSREGIVAPRS